MNDRLNFNDIKFRFAFTIEGYLDREMKNDPRYVKYLVRIFGIKDGVEYQTFIPYHKCTDADWAQFYPPAESARDGWIAIRDDPKRGFFCLDWTADYEIYGNERNDQYQRVEVVLNPCNYLHTEFGYEEDSIDPECIANFDK